MESASGSDPCKTPTLSLYLGSHWAPLGPPGNAGRIKGWGIGRAREVRKGGGGRNKVHFPRLIVFQSGVGPVPGLRFRRSRESSRNRLASWAVEFGWSGRRSLPPPTSSLPPGSVPHSGACPALPPFHSGPLIRLQRQRQQQQPEHEQRTAIAPGFQPGTVATATAQWGAPVRSRSSRARGWGSCQPLSEPEGRGTSQLRFQCSAESLTELGILVGTDMCWTS